MHGSPPLESRVAADFATRAVGPALATIAVSYVLLTLLHPLGEVLTDDSPPPRRLMYAAAASAGVAGLAWLVLRKRAFPATAANLILYLICVLMVANVILYMSLVRDPVHTTNFMLIVLSASLVLTSRPWLVASHLTALGAWAGVAAQGEVNQSWIHWGAMLGLTSLLGGLAHEYRLRTTRKLLISQRRAEEQAERAGAALLRAEREAQRRVSVEEQLRAQERDILELQRRESLGVLAGGIAHDFNNLLTSILGNAQLVADAEPEGSEQRRRINDVLLAGERASRLCRQMLAYSGRAQLEKRVFRLSTLVEDALALVRAGSAGRFSLELDQRADASVEGDPTELGQIVVNLLTNALEASEGRTDPVRVEVDCVELAEDRIRATSESGLAQPGTYGSIVVRDRGAGMPVEVQRRIFEPFFSTKGPSRGLGLAAAVGVVRSHGGLLDVRSTPEEGTSLSLYLPIVARRPLREPVTRTERGLPGKLNVLVVDDEDIVRSVVRTTLSRFEHDIVETDGVTSTRELSTDVLEAIDVALIDVTMPDGSGLDVVKWLRARRPDLPCLLMSGFDRDDVFSEGLPDRCSFIPKPFSPDELLSRLLAASRDPAHARILTTD